MVKIPQNLLITFVSLSYSLLTKNALHCKQNLSNISLYFTYFLCLLAEVKFHNNCCSLFKLSCTTHTTYSYNVNNFPVLINSTDLFYLDFAPCCTLLLWNLYFIFPWPCLPWFLFYSVSLPHHRPDPHTHLSTLSPNALPLFLHCQQSFEINK